LLIFFTKIGVFEKMKDETRRMEVIEVVSVTGYEVLVAGLM